MDQRLDSFIRALEKQTFYDTDIDGTTFTEITKNTIV